MNLFSIKTRNAWGFPDMP